MLPSCPHPSPWRRCTYSKEAAANHWATPGTAPPSCPALTATLPSCPAPRVSGFTRGWASPGVLPGSVWHLDATCCFAFSQVQSVTQRTASVSCERRRLTFSLTHPHAQRSAPSPHQRARPSGCPYPAQGRDAGEYPVLVNALGTPARPCCVPTAVPGGRRCDAASHGQDPAAPPQPLTAPQRGPAAMSGPLRSPARGRPPGLPPTPPSSATLSRLGLAESAEQLIT